MVFTRKTDDILASLVKQIDDLVGKHKGSAAIINFLGPALESVRIEVEQFHSRHGFQHVALVVPVKHGNGPRNMHIHPGFETTVVFYKERSVVTNHSFQAGELEESKIASVIKDVESHLQ